MTPCLCFELNDVMADQLSLDSSRCMIDDTNIPLRAIESNPNALEDTMISLASLAIHQQTEVERATRLNFLTPLFEDNMWSSVPLANSSYDSR